MADSKHLRLDISARVQESNNLDYISNLPDPLLCNILSYIPTKSVVTTSILSKRWKYLWTKVPVLDFSEMPHSGSCCNLGPREPIFKSFVDRVLFLNEVSYVELVRLHFFHGIDVSHANSWLAAILKRDVKEMNLICHLALKMKLPSTFFSREKLVVLKLEYFHLELSGHLHLPSLEIMYIIHGSFPNHDSLKTLLSGCPVLKELVISGCQGLNKLFVSSSSLRKLQVSSCVKVVEEGSITVEAPNLEYLYITDIASHYDFSGLYSLEKAVVMIHHRGYGYRERSVELLRGICGLKTLKLGKPTTEILQDLVLSKLPTFRNIKLPVYHSLILLELTVVNWSMILHMLEYTPKLVSLILYNYSHLSRNEVFPLPAVPTCLSLSLEEVSIDYLSWGEGDLLLVGYLLKNAAVLKSMKIHMVPYTCPAANLGAVEKLRQLFNVSRGCRITVY